MDLTEAGKLPTQTVTGGHDLEQELSLSYACVQTDSDGAISLQVLEFKSQLLEAVEELHIRRDAEGRFEEQISKLVLEKQELEWQKESLQHQIETLSSEHAASIASHKKQFQAKIRVLEEEKGKHQLFADSKEKEVSSLIEELKLLQLSKYSLEKKSSELEQKLALKCRSKDNHLSQLGEVEKRFRALSKQCAMVKLAHEKLEQNVDEAIRVNRKLTSTKEKLESTIVSLKQELEELNKRQIKAKVSPVPHSEASSLSTREQQVHQLQQRLLMETEMNKKLLEENASERARKQEFMSSLQQAQQLLLNQTQGLSRAEIELQTHRQEHQALKREHDVMRGKSAALEDRISQLMEDYTSSRTRWEKERKVLLEHASSERIHVQAVTEAYDQLHQKHSELSSQVILHAQEQGRGLKKPAKGSHSVMTENTLCSSENNLESMKIPVEDSVMNIEDQTVEYELNTQNHHMTEWNMDIGLDTTAVDQTAPSQIISDSIQTSSISDCCHVVKRTSEVGSLSESNPSRELSSLGSLHGSVPPQNRDPDALVVTEAMKNLAGAKSKVKKGQDGLWNCQSSEYREPQIPSTPCATPLTANNLVSLHFLSEATGRQTDIPNITNPTVSESKPTLVSDLADEHVCMSAVELSTGVSVSEPDSMSVYEATHAVGNPPAEGERDGGNISGSKGEQGGEGGAMVGAKGAREVCREDCREGGTTGNDGSETKDGAEKEGKAREAEARTDGDEKGGRLAVRTPETELPHQTSADNTGRGTGRSAAPRCIDPQDSSEPQPDRSLESHHSHTLSEDVTGMDADRSRANEGHRVETLEGLQPLTYVPQSLDDGIQNLGHNGVQACTRDTVQQVSEKTTEASASHPTEDLSGPPLERLAQSHVNSSVRRPDSAINTKVSEPSDVTSRTMETEEQRDKRGSEESMKRVVKPHAIPPSQKTSDHGNGLLTSMTTSSAPFNKTDSQLKIDLFVKDVCEADQSDAGPLSESCVGTRVKHVDLHGPEDSPLFLPGWGISEGFSTPIPSTAEEPGGQHQQCMSSSELEDPEDKATINKMVLKQTTPPLCQEKDAPPESCSSKPSSAQEKLFGDIDYTASAYHKTPSSSFEWGLAPRKKDFDKSEMSCTIPTFLRAKQNRDSMVISRVSDLLSTSSVSWPPSSIKRDQQGEWKAIKDTFQETSAEDPGSRATSPIVSISSGAVCRMPWQTSSSSGKTPKEEPGPCPGSTSGSDRFLSSSQENEEQQSSFRAEISKIQQFLCAERLHLSKRQRTDN